MNSPHQHFVIVLVEPKGGFNIGSVCRVMLNFGFHELRLVKPRVDHLGKEARDMAVTAKSTVLRTSRKFSSLADAIADCQFVVGSTRRIGKYRNDFIGPEEIAGRCAQLAPQHRVALVFGREDHGLTTDELSLCDTFVSIETSPELPSLNLAQAVAICLYECSRLKEQASSPSLPGLPRASSSTKEAMFQHMRQTLVKAGYLDPQNPDHILRTYRRIFSRAGLDEREVRILHGLWSLIDDLTTLRGKD